MQVQIDLITCLHYLWNFYEVYSYSCDKDNNKENGSIYWNLTDKWVGLFDEHTKPQWKQRYFFYFAPAFSISLVAWNHDHIIFNLFVFVLFIFLLNSLFNQFLTNRCSFWNWKLFIWNDWFIGDDGCIQIKLGGFVNWHI